MCSRIIQRGINDGIISAYLINLLALFSCFNDSLKWSVCYEKRNVEHERAGAMFFDVEEEENNFYYNAKIK